MLKHEKDVESDGKHSESEFGRIPEDVGPIIAVVSIHEHLSHAQNPAREIQQDIADTPTERAFTTIVEEGLRDVFDERDEDLDVGTPREKVEPSDHGCQSQDEGR